MYIRSYAYLRIDYQDNNKIIVIIILCCVNFARRLSRDAQYLHNHLFYEMLYLYAHRLQRSTRIVEKDLPITLLAIDLTHNFPEHFVQCVVHTPGR
jgi:hypothetical protein